MHQYSIINLNLPAFFFGFSLKFNNSLFTLLFKQINVNWKSIGGGGGSIAYV